MKNKSSYIKNKKRQVVFFDLDGTLHKQDMFGNFIFYLLCHHPFNILLIVLLIPVIILGMLIKGYTARWPMSVLLWSITFGYSKKHLNQCEDQFVIWFRKRIKFFPIVQQRLNEYLTRDDVDVWVITGSPQSIVEKVYFDSFFLPRIKLLASQIKLSYGGLILTMRCLGHEKVSQLSAKIGTPLQLYSGYSDSKKDDSLLYFCENRWRVTSKGQLRKIK
ncbi:phosphatidylglycerophosphatase C [Pantoea sp. Aalb]|uniref:phosphatidylglycerophosphatase C n=1 Tax=Pantoea sp. Aalb TaxID=2576762 RepID=UPI0013205B89|nr:phosphatidylglycerophosphatase C [Pantoea sp. Aalb]MXP67248.1 acid phosphatase AphA [Pantoea sp. Aalb]